MSDQRTEEGNRRILVGMAAISAYARREARTIRRLIRHQGFPAKKIEGTFTSHADAIDKWLLSRLNPDK